ncbi:hypothetical protein [Treponema sp. R6D11]
MFKRVVLVVITGILLTFSVGAATVSFYVVEAGINEEADKKASELWETAFMDVFFDAGYIISNAPIMRLEKSPSDILQVVDFKEASVCGIDYMLIVLLDYKIGQPVPEEVSFYIYKVTKKEKVFESKIRQKQVPLRDDFSNMKSIARGFVPYIGE